MNSFDLLTKSIGYEYEGTLEDCIWIYRKDSENFFSIQVGFGGVQYVSIYKKNDNVLNRKVLDLTDVKSVPNLFRKLRTELV